MSTSPRTPTYLEQTQRFASVATRVTAVILIVGLVVSGIAIALAIVAAAVTAVADGAYDHDSAASRKATSAQSSLNTRVQADQAAYDAANEQGTLDDYVTNRLSNDKAKLISKTTALPASQAKADASHEAATRAHASADAAWLHAAVITIASIFIALASVAVTAYLRLTALRAAEHQE